MESPASYVQRRVNVGGSVSAVVPTSADEPRNCGHAVAGACADTVQEKTTVRAASRQRAKDNGPLATSARRPEDRRPAPGHCMRLLGARCAFGQREQLIAIDDVECAV